MKQLFFRLQNDKQFQRKIQILSYLKNKNIPVPTAEIAQELKCSLPTLRTEISRINEDLPDAVKIQFHKTRGYYLKFPKDEAFDSYILALAKDTPVYKIINTIFLGQIYPFETVANQLYLSGSTLRNVIHHINAELKRFNITLSTTALDLIGDESDIRFFLFQFYLDFRDCFAANRTYALPYETYEEILALSREMNHPELHISYFRATLWIAILKERLSQKRHAELDSCTQQTITARKSFIRFSQSFRTAFKSRFGIINLPETEVIWAYIVSLHCISYTTCDDSAALEKSVPRFCYEEDRNMTQNITDFLAFELPHEILENCTTDAMRAYLSNLGLLSKLSPQFERVSLPMIDFMKTSLSNLHKIWHSYLLQYGKQYLHPITHINDVAITLSMLHFSLMDHLRSRNITILFSFHGEAGYDGFLIKATELIIPRNVTPIYIIEQQITSELIENTAADIIVSNHDISHLRDTAYSFIRLSYIPTAIEWTHLRDSINHLSKSHGTLPIEPHAYSIDNHQKAPDS